MCYFCFLAIKVAGLGGGVACAGCWFRGLDTGRLGVATVLGEGMAVELTMELDPYGGRAGVGCHELGMGRLGVARALDEGTVVELTVELACAVIRMGFMVFGQCGGR